MNTCMKRKQCVTLALLWGASIVGGTSLFAQQQQTVVMKTTRAVGEQLMFVVNPEAEVYVDWGKGAVKVEGDTIQGTVASQEITLTGDESWNTLICENNNLTELDVSKAQYLTAIYCQNNAISSLTLTGLRSLDRLNCANNQLEDLRLTRNEELTYLNCSNNKLSTLSVYKNLLLKQLIVSGNMLETLSVGSANIEALWCQNNELSSLSLTNPGNLVSLMCNDNAMKRLDVSKAVQVGDLWCDNNQLTTLDLSKNEDLTILSATGNQVTSITYPDRFFDYVYLQDNELVFTDLLSRSKVRKAYAYAPQAEVQLPESVLEINKELDLSHWMYDSNKKAFVKFEWLAADGTPLTVEGEDVDYVLKDGVTTFVKAQNGGTKLKMTSTLFPDLELLTSWLFVKDYSDPTGVGQVGSGSNGLTYTISENSITLKSDKAVKVKMYSIDGVLVWSGSVDKNGQTISLQPGIYTVNGEKIRL